MSNTKRIEYLDNKVDDQGRCRFFIIGQSYYHPGHPDGEYGWRERGQIFYADPRTYGFPRPGEPQPHTCRQELAARLNIYRHSYWMRFGKPPKPIPPKRHNQLLGIGRCRKDQDHPYRGDLEQAAYPNGMKIGKKKRKSVRERMKNARKGRS